MTAPTSPCTARRAQVEAAGAADHLLVTCGAGDGATTQVLVPTSAKGLSVMPMQTIDLTRRFSSVTFDDVRVSADAVVGAPAEAAPDVDRQFQVFSIS